MNEQSNNQILYVAILKNGLPILEMDFRVEGLRYDSTLLMGGITAIKAFIKDFSNRDIKIIDQGDLKLVLQEGKFISAVFLVTDVSPELHSNAEAVIKIFEEKYKVILEKNNIDITKFEDFKEIIIQTFAEDLIKDIFIPKFTKKLPPKLPSSDFWPIVTNINNKNSVAEISKLAGTNIKSVIEILTNLKAHGLIEFTVVVNSYDILVLTPQGTKFIFNPKETSSENIRSKFGEDDLNFFKNIDGKTPIIKLTDNSDLSILETKDLVKFLLIKGYATRIIEEFKLSLVVERIYDKVAKELVILFGGKKASKIFHQALIFGKDKNQLINLVVRDEQELYSFEGLRIHFSGLHGETSQKILEQLLFPISMIENSVEKVLGTKQVKKIEQAVLEAVETNFGEEMSEEIEKILK